MTVEEIFESLNKIEEAMKDDSNGTATHARLSFNAGTYVRTRVHADEDTSTSFPPIF